MATLFLICGMAGAGKTTLAKQLEQAHQALRLSPDEWIATIINDVLDRAELNRLRDPVESLQWTTAQRVLRLGISVILENGFWSKHERMTLQAQARAFGARVELHFLDVPKEELWRRLEQRNAHLPTGSFLVTKHELESWLMIFEPPTSDELRTYDIFSEA